MATAKKIETVKELNEKISASKSVILTDYRGLTHKQLEEIKKALKKVRAEFVVTKNSLFVKALNETGLKSFAEKLKKELQGPTAVVFSFDDEIAALKEMMKFVKTLSLPQVKLGFLGQQELTKEDVSRLVKLPAKNILIGQLVGQLKAPVYALHRSLNWNLQKVVLVLNAIKTKKT